VWLLSTSHGLEKASTRLGSRRADLVNGDREVAALVAVGGGGAGGRPTAVGRVQAYDSSNDSEEDSVQDRATWFRRLRCRVGFHKWVQTSGDEDAHWVACAICGKEGPLPPPPGRISSG
jgi:hypothetical protein